MYDSQFFSKKFVSEKALVKMKKSEKSRYIIKNKLQKVILKKIDLILLRFKLKIRGRK